MDNQLENIKGEIRTTSLVLRTTLVMLIFALGLTYAGQVKDDFDVSVGKKNKSDYSIRVDEVDLYTLYKNQAAILDATCGGKKFSRGKPVDLAMQKKLVKAKQNKVLKQNKLYNRR